MAKQASEIIKWGVLKPFNDKTYSFNTIDIETIDNELYILGYINNGVYHYHLNDFYNRFHEFLLSSVRQNKDILTWSRYDNAHLLKLILKDVYNVNDVLLRINKVSPIYTYKYKGFTFKILNIIKDSMIFSIQGDNDFKAKRLTIYNLKNLFTTDLETTAKNYNISYYSKIGLEYHIIDKKRFLNDGSYKVKVLESNRLDNKVIIDIAFKLLENFKSITGVYPKTIFTAGSLARSYLLAKTDLLDGSQLNYLNIYNKHRYFDDLLKYSMESYHGGKIESYVLGFIPNAKIIDITSAYPYALSTLPQLSGGIRKFNKLTPYLLNNFYYIFIKCDIIIKDEKLIHPIIIKSPINKANISPYGYLKDVIITKPEYDYLISKGVMVIDKGGFIAGHIKGVYPYKKIVDELFLNRLNTDNKSLSELFKTIINSLYGITYELTDEYNNDTLEWLGYRAGDYFNPVIASYITAIIRTYLSNTSNNVLENGGKVFLNMTDSIIYQGNITLDIFSKNKVLGKFDTPRIIKDVIILGAGRYEYKDELTKKWVIKNRGFNVSVKDKAFYQSLSLNESIKIPHRTFVSYFKATTNKFSFNELGYLVDDYYNINPFNLGGKRFIINPDVNLNTDYTETKPVYIEKDLYLK